MANLSVRQLESNLPPIGNPQPSHHLRELVLDIFKRWYGCKSEPQRTGLLEATMNEDRFNMAVRQFLKMVGITSQREIERIVREGKIEGTKLKLRMTLTAENTPLNHVVEETIDLR
jgi:hypothetical protein